MIFVSFLVVYRSLVISQLSRYWRKNVMVSASQVMEEACCAINPLATRLTVWFLQLIISPCLIKNHDYYHRNRLIDMLIIIFTQITKKLHNRLSLLQVKERKNRLIWPSSMLVELSLLRWSRLPCTSGNPTVSRTNTIGAVLLTQKNSCWLHFKSQQRNEFSYVYLFFFKYSWA